MVLYLYSGWWQEPLHWNNTNLPLCASAKRFEKRRVERVETSYNDDERRARKTPAWVSAKSSHYFVFGMPLTFFLSVLGGSFTVFVPQRNSFISRPMPSRSSSCRTHCLALMPWGRLRTRIR